MNPVPRIGTTIAAALLSLAALTACGEAGAPEPLDWWRDGEREIRTTAPAVTAGRTLLAAGDYGNFRLTGEALTQPGAEAALRFHTDGESGYEVVFRPTAPSTGRARAVRSPPCATFTARRPHRHHRSGLLYRTRTSLPHPGARSAIVRTRRDRARGVQGRSRVPQPCNRAPRRTGAQRGRHTAARGRAHGRRDTPPAAGLPRHRLPRPPEGRPDEGDGARHVDELRHQLRRGAQCRGRRYRPHAGRRRGGLCLFRRSEADAFPAWRTGRGPQVDGYLLAGGRWAYSTTSSRMP